MPILTGRHSYANPHRQNRHAHHDRRTSSCPFWHRIVSSSWCSPHVGGKEFWREEEDGAEHAWSPEHPQHGRYHWQCRQHRASCKTNTTGSLAQQCLQRLRHGPSSNYKGQSAADEHWNWFKGNVEKSSGTEGRANNYGLFRAHGY